MATIGTFTRNENGFTGSVKTLNLNVKAVKFVPAEGENESGPDFRVFTGTIEFGAAWKKQSDKGNPYLSVKLDDPSFPGPIYASLVETEGECQSARNVDPLSASNIHPPVGDQRLAFPALARVAKGRPSAGDVYLRL